MMLSLPKPSLVFRRSKLRQAFGQPSGWLAPMFCTSHSSGHCLVAVSLQLLTSSRSIWIIYFVDTIQQGMSNAFVPYVTSSFYQHSLTAATSIMSSLIGGLIKLPLAKVLDIWGRPIGYISMVAVLV